MPLSPGGVQNEYLGERSPRPLASLSITVEIEVAQVRIRTESSVTNAREATVGPRQVPPVQRPGHTRLRSCPTWRAVCGMSGHGMSLR
jgi:hypothetical protein